MSIHITRIAAVMAIPFALASGAALAAGPYGGACGDELDAVGQAIYAAAFIGQKAATDRSNLLAKLDSAAAKLAHDKPLDALVNLDAISDKATDLATAAKPKLDDASGINDAVSDAVTCVGANY